MSQFPYQFTSSNNRIYLPLFVRIALKTNLLCANDPQFPLNFGDGLSGDVSIDMMEFVSDLSAFVFASKTESYYFNTGGSLVVKPLLGFYVALDPTTQMSFLSWHREFSQITGSSGITEIKALALSPDDLRIVVAFGAVFRIATLDTITGDVMYSGTMSSEYPDIVMTYQGVTMDSSSRAVIAYKQGSNQYVHRFDINYGTTQFRASFAGGTPQAIKYSSSDGTIYVVSSYYFMPSGSITNANNILYTSITAAGVLTYTRVGFDNPYIQSTTLFKHFEISGAILGGCFDLGVSSYSSGYFIFNTQTGNHRVKGHNVAGDTECIGFYMFSMTDLGYFFRTSTTPNVYKLAKISNGQSANSVDIYTIDYSSAVNVPTVSLFYQFDTYSYFMVGHYVNPGGNKVGLIEFSDSQIPGTFTCYTPPQSVYQDAQPLNDFNTIVMSQSPALTASSSNLIRNISTEYIPNPIQTKSSYCPSAPIYLKISPPGTFVSSWICYAGIPCTISFTLPYTLSNDNLQTCANGLISDVYLTSWDASTYLTIQPGAIVPDRKYVTTITPTSSQVGLTYIHSVEASIFYQQYLLAYENSIEYQIHVQSCSIVPPVTHTSAITCYHSKSCTISVQTPYTYYPVACTYTIYYSLHNLQTGLFEYQDSLFPNNMFSVTFTPTMAQSGTVINNHIHAATKSSGTPSYVLFEDLSVAFAITISNKCVIKAPSVPYPLTTMVLGDSITSYNFAPFTYSPSYCATSLTYSISLYGGAAVPSYVTLTTFDASGLVITVEPTVKADLKILIKAQAVGGWTMSSSTTWQLNITDSVFISPSNTPPYFESDIDSVIEVKCNVLTDFPLPQITDNENDGFTVKVTTASTIPSLVVLKSDYSGLTFNPVCRTNTTQDVAIKITDDNPYGPQSFTYSLLVSTLYIPPTKTKTDKTSNNNETSEEDSSDGNIQCSLRSKLSAFSGNLRQDTQFEVDSCLLLFPDVQIYSDEKSIYELPQAMLTDPNSLIEVKTKAINSFLNVYKQGKMTLQPDSSQVGNYTITIRLIDRSSMQLVASSMFQIQVLNSGNNPKNGGCPYQNPKDCNPKISSVSMNGVIDVVFPVGVNTVGSDYYDNVTSSLLVTFLPSNTSTVPRKLDSNITSWEVTSFKSQQIQIQLSFLNPLEVSAQDGFSDYVTVQFLSNQYFQSNDKKYRVQVGYIMSYPLPQQFDNNNAASKKTKVVFQAMEKGMTSSLVANFFLAAFLGIAMKQIWGIINTLQILTFMPLMIPQLPSNFQVCLQILQDVSNLNVIPQSVTDWFINAMDSIKSVNVSPNLGSKQETYEKGTVQSENGFRRMLNETSEEEVIVVTVDSNQGKTRLIDNIAYIILAVLVIVVILIVVFTCVKALKRYPRVMKVLISIKNKLLFGVFITTVTKGYLKLTLSFIKQLTPKDSTFESTEQQSQSWGPVIFLCFFSMLPLGVYYFLYFNQLRLTESNFQTAWGALYANLSINRCHSAFTFNAWFLARRFVYTISIAGFFTLVTMINVLLQILMSFALILYIVKVKPFEIPRDNTIEIINELTIMFSFYASLGVITDDSNMSGQLKYSFGFAMIGLVLLNIVLNFTFFLASMFMQLYVILTPKFKSIKERCSKKKTGSQQTDLSQKRPLFQEISQNIIKHTEAGGGQIPENQEQSPNYKDTIEIPVKINTESYFDYMKRKMNTGAEVVTLGKLDEQVEERFQEFKQIDTHTRVQSEMQQVNAINHRPMPLGLGRLRIIQNLSFKESIQAYEFPKRPEATPF